MATNREGELLKRIRNISLRSKIMDAEDTIPLFKDGMYLGFSGFAEGHPKTVPGLLADYVEYNGLAGKMKFNVYTGASIGTEIQSARQSMRAKLITATDIFPYMPRISATAFTPSKMGGRSISGSSRRAALLRMAGSSRLSRLVSFLKLSSGRKR